MHLESVACHNDTQNILSNIVHITFHCRYHHDVPIRFFARDVV